MTAVLATTPRAATIVPRGPFLDEAGVHSLIALLALPGHGQLRFDLEEIERCTPEATDRLTALADVADQRGVEVRVSNLQPLVAIQLRCARLHRRFSLLSGVGATPEPPDPVLRTLAGEIPCDTDHFVQVMRSCDDDELALVLRWLAGFEDALHADPGLRRQDDVLPVVLPQLDLDAVSSALERLPLPLVRRILFGDVTELHESWIAGVLARSPQRRALRIFEAMLRHPDLIRRVGGVFRALPEDAREALGTQRPALKAHARITTTVAGASETAWAPDRVHSFAPGHGTRTTRRVPHGREVRIDEVLCGPHGYKRCRIDLLELDPARIELRAVRVRGRTLDEVRASTRSAAVIGGGHALRTKARPMGWLMVDGAEQTMPVLPRAALLVGRRGAAIARVRLIGIDTGRCTLTWSAEDTQAWPGVRVAYTPAFGSRSPQANDRVDVVLQAHAVLERHVGGGAPIPRDGFVLSMPADDPMLEALAPRTRLRSVTNAPRSLGEVRHAIACGPRLMEAGVCMIDFDREAFGATPLPHNLPQRIQSYETSRSFAGLKPDGTVVFGHVRGAAPDDDAANEHPGMTFGELAILAQDLGLTDALALPSGPGGALSSGPTPPCEAPGSFSAWLIAPNSDNLTSS
ncbi:MAG: phosphodiester glycosidase family protein [Myxococcota bacterium]